MKLFPNSSQALVLTHYYFREEGGGDIDERILIYLKSRTKKAVLITSPFPESSSSVTYCYVYKDGEKTDELRIENFKGSFILQFFHQFLITYYLLFKVGLNYNLCIAIDNLSLLMILPLKACFFIQRAVYYTLDFVPSRFTNPLLEAIYRFINKIACKYSDKNWMVTKQQRDAYFASGINYKKSKFRIVPIGYDTKNIETKKIDDIDFYNIVYAGGLRESHGPQLAIQAVPLLIKKFPKIKLTIIGGGRYADQLKKIAQDLKVDKYIEFTGYIGKFESMTDVISGKSIGLAPYSPQTDSFSFYSDPSKIKLYLACGLPVIATNVTTMSMLIHKKVGLIIDYSESDLAEAILEILGNRKKYTDYKNSASLLAQKYDISEIMDAAIDEIPE